MRTDALPGAAEFRAQERADKAANDEVERLLNASPDETERHLSELASESRSRAAARRNADPDLLFAELDTRVNGPVDDEIRAEPEKGSYAWRVRELDRMGIRTYGTGGSH